MTQSFLKDFLWRKVLNRKGETGHIVWLLLDIDNEKIVWCIYKKTFLEYGYFLFNSSKLHWDVREVSEWYTSQAYYDIIGKTVKNQDSQFVWSVTDLEFDVTFHIKNIYVYIGYHFTFDTNQFIQKHIIKVSNRAILSYEKSSIFIRDKQNVKENKKTLEKLSKIFINIQKPNYNVNSKEYE